ncbi:MAG: threonine/serine dehydratase [Alphaproteobacteria bacterium]|nr:threonine/serine dehydratase [Alphaproteobacteria bacterium]
MISPDDIEQAVARITPHVRETPVMALERGAFGLSAAVTLKLELLQHTGSFKPRGAFNRILSSSVPAAGVIAASGGNHGLATAFAARELGHRAEIFVPQISSPVKIARLRDYGAIVNVGGASYAEAFAASEKRVKETGALVVHAYDQPEVLAGQGTTGREFDRQAPGLDTILVAVGGGGLIGGVAAWYQGRVKIVGVEPEAAPTLAHALEAGAPVDVAVGGVAADSLGAKRVGDLMFTLARKHIERVVLVTDDAIRAAQRALWETLRVAAEPGGAAAMAALLSGAYKPHADERVGVLVCGGNVDPSQLLEKAP